MKKTFLFRAFFLAAISFLAMGIAIFTLLEPAQPARGKSSATPLSNTAAPQQHAAQELALEDARVIQHTADRRTEVFGARDMMGQFTPASRECETNVCYQVEIYDFDRNATITAIVDLTATQVRDVLYLENAQPGVNKRLANLAAELANNHPEVIEILGYRPRNVDVAAVTAGMTEGYCDGRHLCVGLVYFLPDGLLSVIVDLTLEEVAGVIQVEMPPESPQTEAPFVPESCPAPGTVERDGWSLAYQTTGWDGLRVHTVSYQGIPVINNIKLVEWHIAYSSGFGYVDITGCSGGGGGFPIYPYGETQLIDLFDADNELIGFEVRQDFRMSNWGSNCNYRYEQRIQFFNDGRFRVVSGAFGKGCNTVGVYRPVVRIDIAVSGSENNSFATWDGDDWQTHQEEFWQLQEGPYTAEGYRWMVYNQNGDAFYIEPGVGQFEGSPEPDNAYIYVTMHRPAEGDIDLPAIGTCCNSDHRQGPHNFINGDPIENQNIVIWYVSQMAKNGAAPPYSCWTVSGGANPETYPCFSGPMFVPATEFESDYGLALAPAAAAQPGLPGSVVTYTLTITNTGILSDAYTFAVSGNNWTATLPEAVALDAAQAAEATITVAVPAQAAGGAWDAALVTATSAGNPAITASATLTSTAEIVYGVALSPATAVQSGQPGSVLTYTVTITNSGNISDTFTIAFSGNNWATAVPVSVTLALGESTQVAVSVTIPATAVGGHSDAVSIAVASVGDETVTAVAILTTTAVIEAETFRLYLPLVLKP